jgi:hypothetical protein
MWELVTFQFVFWGKSIWGLAPYLRINFNNSKNKCFILKERSLQSITTLITSANYIVKLWIQYNTLPIGRVPRVQYPTCPKARIQKSGLWWAFQVRIGDRFIECFVTSETQLPIFSGSDWNSIIPFELTNQTTPCIYMFALEKFISNCQFLFHYSYYVIKRISPKHSGSCNMVYL